eukprot:TRINITY_DN635_c0_g1_i1.p1 TRINITY_DN635_c0_g1~~TRINITY_DN635_c0_g1_i1.p1  ORF type:complete len:282 (-),score=28.62 TRINITY_DN635_c0_g1_i1:174-1019(-)
MAEDKLNKSLEQLIEENRATRNVLGRQSRGGSRFGSRGGRQTSSDSRQVRRGGGAPAATSARKQQLTVVVKNSRGGIRKPGRATRNYSTTENLRRGFGIRNILRQQQQYNTRLRDQKAVHEALEGDAKWQHDLFVDDQQPSGLIEGSKRYRPVTQQNSGILVVSNLNYNVSNEDIHELFSRIGDVRKYGIKFDRSGRSEGIAEVEFVNAQDAQNAVKQYDGVMLDGKRMSIQIKQQEDKKSNKQRGSHIATLKSGIQVSKPQQQQRVTVVKSRQFDAMDID